MEPKNTEEKIKKGLIFVIIPVLLTGIFGIVKTLIAKEKKQKDPIEVAIKDSRKRITELQKHTPKYNVPKNLDRGNLEDSTLALLYDRSNQEFVNFIHESIENLKEKNNEKRLGYLNAPAGAGKSTYFEERWPDNKKIDSKKTQIFKISNNSFLRVEDLKKWFSNSSLEPDLIKLNTNDPINLLPGNEKVSDSIFQILIDTFNLIKDNSIIVLDGIDEISNSAAVKLLTNIDFYLTSIPKESMNIIVSGRPEGFKDYLRVRSGNFELTFSSFKFNTPKYNNFNALRVRHSNFADYRKKCCGEESPQFEFLHKTLIKHPFLFDDFSLLMLSGPIIKSSENWVKEDAFKVKEILFGEIIKRNQVTHQRPPTSNDEYMMALEEILLNQLVILEEKGAYYVGPNETVKYGQDKVNIRNMLNRSGLIYFEPTDTDKFYFIPNWLPTFILERKILRLQNEK